MIRQAYQQFPQYANQIRCQVPPCFHDASLPDEEDLDCDTKWARIRKMVEFFNGIFNAREAIIDKEQKLQRDPGSLQQFISEDEDDEKGKKRRKGKSRGNSARKS